MSEESDPVAKALATVLLTLKSLSKEDQETVLRTTREFYNLAPARPAVDLFPRPPGVR